MPKDIQPEIEEPNLLERTFAAGCSRVAVVSLHPGAGARTAVESIAHEFGRRGIPTGVTRAPRLPLEADDVTDELTRISLPEGTIVATTDSLAADHERLELLEPIGCRSALGHLGLYRVLREGDVPVYGPDDPRSMGEILDKLERHSGGLALVDGAWERRGFAAPHIAGGVILVLGSGFSGSPERSAAALSYVVEILSAASCDAGAAAAWPDAAEQRAALALDPEGRALGRLPWESRDPAGFLEQWSRRIGSILLPGGLHDALLAPLSRSSLRCPLVVKNATRIYAAPIYYKAWLRGGGSVRVVQPMRVLAVATNPVNASGPDVDADRFRELVVESFPELPVHDVRLESNDRTRKPVWKFWA